MSFPAKNDNQFSTYTIITCLLIVCIAIGYNSLRNELGTINERLQMLEQDPSVESVTMRGYILDNMAELESDLEDMRARIQAVEARRR